MDTVDGDVLDRADMARLVAGQDAALSALMERHATPIFHFLYRMLGSEDDANDLAQETFVRVYRARASYRPEQKLSAWLYTIAANLARNQLRWRSRHPNVSLDAESETSGQSLGESMPASVPAPDQAAELSERIAGVHAAVLRLPDDLREAVVLCEWEDLAVAEAAAVLNTTAKAVESRLYRARQLLRERLKKWL
jgi:RNA polymerase sigma-70 factor, ECF subfamily